MKNFKVDTYGYIVNEDGSLKYYNEFTEEKLKSLPPCPGNRKDLCYFNTKTNRWNINYTIWD